MSVVSNSGRIGVADLAAGTPVNLGTLGAAMTVNVLICNRNASTVTTPKVRIAISTSAITPADSEWIDYDTQVFNARERGGIAASAGENIWIISDTSAVSARAHGVLLP